MLLTLALIYKIFNDANLQIRGIVELNNFSDLTSICKKPIFEQVFSIAITVSRVMMFRVSLSNALLQKRLIFASTISGFILELYHKVNSLRCNFFDEFSKFYDVKPRQFKKLSRSKHSNSDINDKSIL